MNLWGGEGERFVCLFVCLSISVNLAFAYTVLQGLTTA
jgi:hypothetical protein